MGWETPPDSHCPFEFVYWPAYIFDMATPLKTIFLTHAVCECT